MLTAESYCAKRVDFRMRFSQSRGMSRCLAVIRLALRAAALAAGTFGWFWAWWIIGLAIEGAAP